LPTSINAGNVAGMSEMRKITVEVPDDDLAAAQDYIGAGITETVRAALKRLRSDRAQQKALELRGKVKFSMTWQEMKYDRE
jgi:Arc/MetJ-type ribon-helix-helix transcriptional regulator